VLVDWYEGEPLLTRETVDHLRALVGVHGSDCWWTMTTAQLLPPSYSARAHEYERGTDTMDVWLDSGTWLHSDHVYHF
jgi:isoleucyl-tRNA synthetase